MLHLDRQIKQQFVRNSPVARLPTRQQLLNSHLLLFTCSLLPFTCPLRWRRRWFVAVPRAPTTWVKYMMCMFGERCLLLSDSSAIFEMGFSRSHLSYTSFATRRNMPSHFPTPLRFCSALWLKSSRLKTEKRSK